MAGEVTSGLNGRMLNPFIDFDFIVDTDLGLLRLIRAKYQDERAFKLDILNKSDRELLSLLYSRKNWNPLSVISTEENMSDIDELYNSFFSNLKKEIISLSITEKNIHNFIKSAISSSNTFGMKIYIGVDDELEEMEIIKHFGEVSTVLIPKNPASIISKDPIYAKDYRLFTENKLTSISAHKLYMSPRQYNIDYFETVSNNLTNRNELILMGRNYGKRKEE